MVYYTWCCFHVSNVTKLCVFTVHAKIRNANKSISILDVVLDAIGYYVHCTYIEKSAPMWGFF